MLIQQEVALSYKNGVEDGIARGIEQSIAQGIEQLAKKMLSSGLPVEKIIEITGLTKEQLQALSEQKTE